MTHMQFYLFVSTFRYTRTPRRNAACAPLKAKEITMEPVYEAQPYSCSDKPGVARYLSEIAHFPPLSAALEEALVLSLPQAEAATTLIEGYLSHVVQIAQQYRDQGVPLMDLIGEGNLCLVQAVQAFHMKRAASFRHLLDTALHRTMKQALSSNALPGPRITLVPFDAEAVNWDRVLTPSSQLSCRSPEEALIAKAACEGIFLILHRLSYRQRQTLGHYYGFVGQVHGSFAALAREWGISPSAVRASAVEGIHKLRWARRELSEYLGDAFYLP